MNVDIIYLSNSVKFFLLIILIFIFIYLYNKKEINVGIIPLCLLLFFTILYTFINISINMKLISNLEMMQEIILRPIGLGIVLSCFYLVLEYTGNKFNKKSTIYVLFSYFVAIFLLFITNANHYLLYSEHYIGKDGYIELINTNLFFLFYIAPTSLIIVSSISIMLLYSIKHTVSRKQSVLIIIGLILGYVSISIESVMYTFHQSLDLDVLGISMGVIIISYSLININTTKKFPLTKNDIMNNIDELILSTTTSNTISDITLGTDINLQIDTRNIGDSIENVFDEYNINIIDIINNKKSEIIEHKNNNRTEYYKIKSYRVQRNVNIFINKKQNMGSIIIIENITEDKNKDEKIKLLKNIFGRILRHNIRNELNVIMGHTDIIQTKNCNNIHNNMNKIDDSTSKLLNISKKSQRIEKVISNINNKTKFNSTKIINKSMRKFTNKDQNVNFNVNIIDSFEFTAHEQFILVINEIIENGIEHNQSIQKDVTITSVIDDESEKIIIEDNGTGIQNNEIEPIFNNTNETKLEHGSSLGLWLIKFITDLSDLEIEFINIDNGTKVIIETEPI